MKDYIKTVVLLISFSFAACESWLDVQPETQITEESLLTTGDGYRSVLNGLYKTMGETALYGKELTWGMLDCISQQYKLGEDNFYAGKIWRDFAKLDYTTTYSVSYLKNVWTDAYNIIANANNLIQNLKNASPDLFSQGEMEKNLILGEAYACRAFMHFDMLRLFAPAPVNDDGKAYVPYVEAYPSLYSQKLGVQSCIDKIITDLEQARPLVVVWDTSLVGRGTLIRGESRFHNTFVFGTEIYGNQTLNVESFFKGRGYRMHYFAVTALLARAYQYAGRYQEAYECAKEVLEFKVKSNYGNELAFDKDDFSGVSSTNWNNKKDLKTISNLLFGVYNENAYEDFGLSYSYAPEYTGSAGWFVLNLDGQKVFQNYAGVDESDRDYRYLRLTYLAGGEYPISGKYYCSTDETTRDYNATVIPLIRATEMKYIMAEYYARQNNFPEAKKILEDIRKARGCVESLSISSWADFVSELIRDARREWIGEGQLFYLYKRLNASVDFGNGTVRPFTRSEYLLPIPTNEGL